MKAYVFSVIANIIAAIVLFEQGAHEMNNLGTSIPAMICSIAAVLTILQIVKEKKHK